jgi:hypothetical protein
MAQWIETTAERSGLRGRIAEVNDGTRTYCAQTRARTIRGVLAEYDATAEYEHPVTLRVRIVAADGSDAAYEVVRR